MSSTKFVFFRADRKIKMAALAPDWLRHFRLPLWNGWTEFNGIWQAAWSKRPLPSLCFFRADLKNKMAALASDWLTHFRLLCNRWTELNETWQEARFYSSFTEFVFFGPIGKTRGLPWPLIGWDIFDFVSETAKQNLTKLDRKHDLNALYQVCGFFFMPIKKKKPRWPPWPLYWLRRFRHLLWNRWMEF